MPETTAEIEVVRAFLAAIERLDADAAIALLHPDVSYQNVPLPAAHGVRAVGKQLHWLARYARGFEVVWDNVASNGPIVLTERTDIITIGPVSAAFWVCGTFEVRDGKILLWRDRFDYVDSAHALIWGVVRAVVARVRGR